MHEIMHNDIIITIVTTYDVCDKGTEKLRVTYTFNSNLNWTPESILLTQFSNSKNCIGIYKSILDQILHGAQPRPPLTVIIQKRVT